MWPGNLWICFLWRHWVISFKSRDKLYHSWTKPFGSGDHSNITLYIDAHPVRLSLAAKLKSPPRKTSQLIQGSLIIGGQKPCWIFHMAALGILISFKSRDKQYHSWIKPFRSADHSNITLCNDAHPVRLSLAAKLKSPPRGDKAADPGILNHRWPEALLIFFSYGGVGHLNHDGKG